MISLELGSLVAHSRHVVSGGITTIFYGTPGAFLCSEIRILFSPWEEACEALALLPELQR